MADTTRDWIPGLVSALYKGTIDRRTFMKRAAATGISAGLIGQVITRYDALAQDATPAAGGLIPGFGVTPNTDKSGGTIKFYSSWPMTGASETIGGHSAAGIELALADFGGAAGGFAIEYKALDDGIAANQGGWDQGKEAENANLVVNDADAMVYIATYNSGASKVSIPITNEAGLLQITPEATYPGLTKNIAGVVAEGEPDVYYPSGKRNYYRVVPTDEIQGSAAANWAYNENGNRKAYILNDNQLYGNGVATVFKNAFTALGGEVVGYEAFDAGAGEYQSLMASIADKGPDIVYVGAIVNQNASKLLQDMRAVMPPEEVTFMGPDGLNNQAFIDGAGGDAEGAWITFAGLPPDALAAAGGYGADWVNRMMEKVGVDSPGGIDPYSVYAYEAAVVALQAVDKAAKKDRAAILDVMDTFEDFVGLLGTWHFTETKDTSSTIMALSKVIDGKLVFQKPISA